MGKVVQVWQISLEVSEDTLASYFTCLSHDEKTRANRFRFADDRRRFIVARGTLRHLLGRQFAQAPNTIEFCYSEYGKPFTAARLSTRLSAEGGSDGDFHFNLSHSGEIALCALGHDRNVGVDIEKLKPIKSLDGMMERCFLATEQSQIKNADNPSHAFLQRWTCKEAYLKAIGLGLTQSMQTVEVQLTPPQFVCVPQDCAEGWHLELISVPDDYVGAVVIAGKALIQTHHWRHLSDEQT